MLKHILATTALATLLTTGLHAQTTTGTARDAAEGEAAPLVQDEGGAGTGVEGGASAVVGGAANAQDATVMPDPATTAQDDVTIPMDGAAPDQAGVGGSTGPGVANEGTDPVPPGGDATGSAEDAGTAAEPLAAGEDETGASGTADPVATEGAGAGAGETVQTTTAPAETEGAATGASEGALAEEGWSPVDLGAVSTERLVGQDIVTNDDETIATIEEVLLDDTGQVGSVVARFGGFLGFGSNRVQLQTDEIEVMSNEGDELLVRTGLTPESIETRPEYPGPTE